MYFKNLTSANFLPANRIIRSLQKIPNFILIKCFLQRNLQKIYRHKLGQFFYQLEKRRQIHHQE